MNLTNFDQTIPYFAARGTRPITDSLLQPRRVGRRLVIEPRQKTQCTGDTLPTRSSASRTNVDWTVNWCHWPTAMAMAYSTWRGR
ncbi:hypothetical protein X797_004431 [Metarhizium robertsii]|uniref:Uncharacterized protein n=1 Tax=Metarhizium robertsii TaxID=568076 RepID=A0A0A1UW87_9HYPO|nr:hypothetical protein X797_004431 [Metarhizium robertsii]